MSGRTLQVTQNHSRRTLIFMGIFIFLISVGEGMTAPAIPLYGDELGATYKQLGFLMTGYSIAYAAMTVFSGRMSDQYGRKKILLLSIILSILASTGYYFATSPMMLLAFRTLEGMSRGMLWPVAEAIVADNTNFEGRGKAMGHFSAAYGGGVATGTLTGGYIMEYMGLTQVFPFYPILGIIVFGTVLLGVKEAVGEDHYHGSPRQGSMKNLYLEVKKIWPICYVGFAYAGFLYSIWGLLSKVANTFGVAHLGIGVIFTFFWLSRLSAFIICGRAIDWFGRKKVFLAGIIFCSISAGSFLIASEFYIFLFAALLGGVGTGIIFPLSITLVADFASPKYRGFGMGFLELVMGMGMIIQTAISGILGELAGVHMTFFFTFLVMLIALPISILFVKEPIGEYMHINHS